MAIDIHSDVQDKDHQQAIDPIQSQEFSEEEHDNALLREAIYTFLSSIYLQPITEDSLLQICDTQFLANLAEVLAGKATTVKN